MDRFGHMISFVLKIVIENESRKLWTLKIWNCNTLFFEIFSGLCGLVDTPPEDRFEKITDQQQAV